MFGEQNILSSQYMGFSVELWCDYKCDAGTSLLVVHPGGNISLLELTDFVCWPFSSGNGDHSTDIDQCLARYEEKKKT